MLQLVNWQETRELPMETMERITICLQGGNLTWSVSSQMCLNLEKVISEWEG